MGNIFKGLSASGSWGCFDEFNRLRLEVLSVCTVQYKSVLDALRGMDGDIPTRVIINGDEVNCKRTVMGIITMNPGYAGRATLPEGLKALFRPMTVMVPDMVLICENMLMAEGFTEAKVLASKFYGLYALLRDLLSAQKHYDWGLRAVKSVLRVAGSMLRAEPELDEAAILMRGMFHSVFVVVFCCGHRLGGNMGVCGWHFWLGQFCFLEPHFWFLGTHGFLGMF